MGNIEPPVAAGPHRRRAPRHHGYETPLNHKHPLWDMQFYRAWKAGTAMWQINSWVDGVCGIKLLNVIYEFPPDRSRRATHGCRIRRQRARHDLSKAPARVLRGDGCARHTAR